MAIKFATNVPVTLCFPYGDFKPVNGNYGPQFLYSVEVEGVQDKLYATPALHQELQAAHVGPGASLTITKVEGEGNRKGWLVRSNGGNGTPEEDAPSASAASSAPTNGREREPVARPDFAGLELLMNHCLAASWKAWQGLDDEAQFSSEDVRGVGITLFLECARKGVLPQAVEEGLPF